MKQVTGIALSLALFGCTPTYPPLPSNPSRDFADRLRTSRAGINDVSAATLGRGIDSASRAQLRLVDGMVGGDVRLDRLPPRIKNQAYATGSDSGMGGEGAAPAEPLDNLTRPYVSPLAYGDPGVTSSLWREARTGNELFRDHRAFQPLDLITVIIDESAEGKKEGDTETKSSSDVSASIDNFLGLEKYVKKLWGDSDLASLAKAATENNFKGEGSTNRKDTLKGRVSALVVEVLPSGVLRIEGEKIVAVNNEEQVMVVSGLVRTQDISSKNEVSSQKIANMRVDYYGRGTVSEAQFGGWASRFMRVIWPF